MQLIVILSLVGHLYIQVPSVQANCQKELTVLLSSLKATDPTTTYEGRCMKGTILPYQGKTI